MNNLRPNGSREVPCRGCYQPTNNEKGLCDECRVCEDCQSRDTTVHLVNEFCYDSVLCDTCDAQRDAVTS